MAPAEGQDPSALPLLGERAFRPRAMGLYLAGPTLIMPPGPYSSGLGLTEPLRSGARGLPSRSLRSSICGRGGLLRKRKHWILNVLIERAGYSEREYHHEEREGHKVKLDLAVESLPCCLRVRVLVSWRDFSQRYQDGTATI